MGVKTDAGRRRYVAFRLDGGPITRAALSGLLPPPHKLTRFDGTYGIVKTLHTERDACLAFLAGVRRIGVRDVRIETLTTSGTIRGAARSLPPESPASRRERPRDA